jgi:transposase
MRKYDDDYKREAVKKIHDGQSVASISRELGVSESVLHKWRKEAVATASDGEREVLELKRRLREVEMERDILKKAALIFGRSG